MEMIQLSGYTMREKLDIARRTWCPSRCARTACGRARSQVEETALRVAIGEYTREAGVRNLEREIGNICRKVARRRSRRRPSDQETGAERDRGAAIHARRRSSLVSDRRGCRQGPRLAGPASASTPRSTSGSTGPALSPAWSGRRWAAILSSSRRPACPAARALRSPASSAT